MPIYTGAGDKGETTLGNGTNTPKDHPRVEAYGSIDELNSLVGVVLAHYKGQRVNALKEVQRMLFSIGAQLASPKAAKAEDITEKITQMEKEIDEIEKALPPVKHFILPNGSNSAALLHLARTVCRRTERRVVTLSKNEKIDPQLITYLNRLGDLFFMLAREENVRAKIPEEEWRS